MEWFRGLGSDSGGGVAAGEPPAAAEGDAQVSLAPPLAPVLSSASDVGGIQGEGIQQGAG